MADLNTNDDSNYVYSILMCYALLRITNVNLSEITYMAYASVNVCFKGHVPRCRGVVDSTLILSIACRFSTPWNRLH